MSERFPRELTRHRFTAREVTVLEVTHPVEVFVRVTLGGPDLHDFASSGPTDHMKTFFPHPVTGEFNAPSAAGPEEDGVVQPDAQTFGRFFTPLNVRVDPSTGATVFDIDLLRHDNPGPASAWAERAAVGDRLVVVGPRGSRGIPTGISTFIGVVDPTALPAASRWIAGLPEAADIEIIADVSYADLEWVEEYLRLTSGREVLVREALGGLDQALLDCAIDADTYVFAAGEASSLVPLRRAIRTELGLSKDQYSVNGYWRRGEANFDHHTPIDPEDPEE